MSLALLHETRAELRRLSIAGSALAKDDFRLKKLIPQLAEAGKTAPVFARLAALVEKTVNADTSGLLEAGVLVNAVLTTQTAAGLTGEIRVADGEGFTPSAYTYKMIKPLHEVLTTRGSGRLEVIEQGIASGLILDPRLGSALVGALNDSYADIPLRIIAVLRGMDNPAPLLPFLLRDFDPSGKPSTNIVRLEILGRILKDKGQALYQNAYERGAPAIQIKALEMMGYCPECESLLIDESAVRKQERRAAAFAGLGKGSGEAGRAVLLEALQGAEHILVAKGIAEGGELRLLQDMTTQGLELLEKIPESPVAQTDKKTAATSDIVRLFAILGGIRIAPVKTPAMYELARKAWALTMHVWEKDVELALDLPFFDGMYDDYTNETNIRRSCRAMTTQTVASFATVEALSVLEEVLPKEDSALGVKLNKAVIATMVRLGLRLQTPEHFYDLYHPLFRGGKREAAGSVMCDIFLNLRHPNTFLDLWHRNLSRRPEIAHITLDPRWCDLFVRYDLLRLVVLNAAPGLDKVKTYLSLRLRKVSQLLKTAKSSADYDDCIMTADLAARGLLAMNETDFLDGFIDWLENGYILPNIMNSTTKNATYYVVPRPGTIVRLLVCLPDREKARAMLVRVQAAVQEKKASFTPATIELINLFDKAVRGETVTLV